MTGAAGGGRRVLLPLLVALLCAAPHVLRFVLPTTSSTDPFYAEAAMMIARGYTPYLHFTQVAFPFAEQALSLALRTWGTELRVVELCNDVVVLLVALVLYRTGRRLSGPLAGAAAAVFWCWSLWVVHFNLFERETWVALGTSLALCFYLGGLATARDGARDFGRGRVLAIAAALLLAFVIKITAIMALFALLAHLALTRRARTALALLAAWLAGAAALTLCAWLAWGAPFLMQVYLFGFYRYAPFHTLAASGLQFLGWTDAVQAAGLTGLLVLGLPRLRGPEGAVTLWLLADMLFFLVISPIVWSHNLINVAPACALLGGALLADLVRSAERRATAAAAGALVLASVGVLPETWLPGDYGAAGPYFGGRTRLGIEQQADFLRRYSRPDDIVSTTEPWCAFAAGRVEFVRFYDLQPVALGLEASVEADGVLATFGKRQGPFVLGPGTPPPDPRVLLLAEFPYAQRIAANALVYVRPLFLQALTLREVALVMEPLPHGVISAQDLRQADYRRFTDPVTGIAGWRPAHGRPYPRVRAVFQP